MRIFLVALTALLLNLPGTGRAETLYFIHVDHLGTPRLAIGEDDVERWRWEQAEPFGDNPPLEVMGPEGYAINLPLRFPGQYADKETNLAYNMARDFDSRTGRFLQADPVGVGGLLSDQIQFRSGTSVFDQWVTMPQLEPIDPRSLVDESVGGGGLIGSMFANLYGYANDDPLSWIDTGGLAATTPGGFAGCVRKCNASRNWRIKYLCAWCGPYRGVCIAWAQASHVLCIADCQARHFPKPPSKK